MPLNARAAGKTYPPGNPFEITDHDSFYYALAYNEDNDFYFDKRKHGYTITPPMYAARYMGESVIKVLNDKELGFNLAMMVHIAQEFEWLLPVKSGDRIASEAKIRSIEPGKFGDILKCEVIARNQHEDIAAKSIWSFLDRSAASPDAGHERPRKITGEFMDTQEMKVRNGQTWIYAEASGDSNPIHLSDQAARDAGLDGIILQGLCTMAFAHKVCADKLAGENKDPMRIKKLSVKFARPVRPGDILIFNLYRTGNISATKDHTGRDEKNMASNGQSGIVYDIIALNQRNKKVLQDAWCLVV